MTASDLAAMLPAELAMRSVQLNPGVAMRDRARYVLVWLQQTLRGHDNPVIDAGVALGNRLGLPVLVYHGLRCDYPYASERLSRFIVGASAVMGRRLAARGIACAQLVQESPDHGKGMVYRLAADAAAVVVDEHFTFVPHTQPLSFADKAGVPVLAVDGTRLVPMRALPERVGTTIAFRKAHSERRDAWRAMRAEVVPEVQRSIDGLPGELVRLGALSEGALDALVGRLPIDRTLGTAADYPATEAGLAARLDALTLDFIKAYKVERSNPSAPHGATHLSPYLRFGMTSPWEVMDRIDATEAPPSYRYKFYDELLTWREWSHWRLWRNPAMTRYGQLANWAQETLAAHRDDPREPVLTLDQLMHGETPDRVWNAAQNQWRTTGWLHNNLRMYWSKGLLRWAPTPELAWAWGCYLNDRQSIDGRDPATYASMRWGFGDARPAWRETPVYGRLMPNSAKAVMQREGVPEFVERWAGVTGGRVSVADFDAAAYL